MRKAEWARKDREKKKRMAAELKAAQDAAIEMASEAMTAQAQLDQHLKQLLKQLLNRAHWSCDLDRCLTWSELARGVLGWPRPAVLRAFNNRIKPQHGFEAVGDGCVHGLVQCFAYQLLVDAKIVLRPPETPCVLKLMHECMQEWDWQCHPAF